MFHQSFNPIARLDMPLRVPKEVHQRWKSLARRLEEQDRELQLLSLEEQPPRPQHRSEPDGTSSCHVSCSQKDDTQVNSSNNSCPAVLSATDSPDYDDDLCDCPGSPLTHPPRTVIIRAGDLHGIETPQKRNCMHRKRLFSIDFSTICTEKESTLMCEIDEENALAAASLEHYNFEWDDALSISTYPPTSIMFIQDNHLDIIATPRRNRTYRSNSDLSTICSSQQERTSTLKQLLPTLPNLQDVQLSARDEHDERLYKYEETDDDEDQIPHVMSCPDIFGDSDEDDLSDFIYDERNCIVRSVDTASCPGLLLTHDSIASVDI